MLKAAFYCAESRYSTRLKTVFSNVKNGLLESRRYSADNQTVAKGGFRRRIEPKNVLFLPFATAIFRAKRNLFLCFHRASLNHKGVLSKLVGGMVE